VRKYSDRPRVEQSSLSNWRPPARVQVIAILGATLLALGAFLALLNPALLVGKGEQMNNAARVFAGYLVSRNLSLAALLAGALALRARKALGALITLTALIQFVDAAVDCYEQRWAIVPVVVVLGLAFLIGAGSTLGRSVWKIEVWRDS
jgi:hypothetical protein